MASALAFGAAGGGNSATTQTAAPKRSGRPDVPSSRSRTGERAALLSGALSVTAEDHKGLSALPCSPGPGSQAPGVLGGAVLSCAEPCRLSAPRRTLPGGAGAGAICSLQPQRPRAGRGLPGRGTNPSVAAGPADTARGGLVQPPVGFCRAVGWVPWGFPPASPLRAAPWGWRRFGQENCCRAAGSTAQRHLRWVWGLLWPVCKSNKEQS